ncbi:MAG: hypothetical protein AAF417_11375 [Pseudomonadota bacterium]
MMKTLTIIVFSVFLGACATSPDPRPQTPLLSYAELSAEISVERSPIDDPHAFVDDWEATLAAE